jgi:hypothetical protein
MKCGCDSSTSAPRELTIDIIIGAFWLGKSNVIVVVGLNGLGNTDNRLTLVKTLVFSA